MGSPSEYMPAPQRAERAASFGSVAGEYERGRPGYPAAAIDWLLGRAPLEVLDLGAGTGKLAEAASARGHRVSAVEPLAQMRVILSARLPAVRVMAGTAEELPLEDASVDAVLVGAAFHWFEQERALAEIVRVLREPGVLGLLGNAFDTTLPWVAALRGILGPPAIERPRHWPAPELLRERFAEVADEEFGHEQEVRLSTLLDLACSRSSVAVLAEHERAELLGRIERLWRDSPELAGRERVALPWVARARRCRGLLGSSARWRVLSVDAETVRPLRGEVLRPGRPAQERVFEGDERPDSLHAAVIDGGRMVGVASVLHERCEQIPSPAPWRIRGMATAPGLRGRGIGTALLARCEQHARAHAGTLLWCHARVHARSLYERAGMAALGGPFEVPPIGEHYLMFKRLPGPAG